MLHIRQLTEAEGRVRELLPFELRDWNFPQLDWRWCWIAEDESGPLLLVIGSYVHGIFFFWRILATASARKRLLTHFLATATFVLQTVKDRGCIAYGSFLLADKPQERKLKRIIERAGGKSVEFNGFLSVCAFKRD